MQIPLISIVIPTHSRPAQLTNCLDALVKQDYEPARFEVIVVDDGGDVDLTDLVNNYRRSLNLTLLRQRNGGPASARNTGAAQSCGELLAFTDDDCIPAPNWLNELGAAIGDNLRTLAGGTTKNLLKKNFFSEASQALVDYLFEYYATSHTEMRFFTSNNMICRREDFNAVGGFSLAFKTAAAEDREFCNRWLVTGNSLVHARDAVVFHAHELSAGKFWHQHFNYGRGAFKFQSFEQLRARVQFRLSRSFFTPSLWQVRSNAS